MIFRIKNNSGILSTFSAEVYDSENRLIYFVNEETGSLFKALLRLTKFRTALSLKITFNPIDSGMFFLVTRNAGLFSHSYFVRNLDGTILYSFEPESFSWKSVFSLRKTLDIKDGHGGKIATYVSSNPFILGPQNGEVISVYGEVISHFEWQRPSLFRTPRECLVSINRVEAPWDIISITAAIIKALYFEFR